jgi:hypothetical protein
MAKFRKVQTAFWDDEFIEKLSPEDRYFYLFLLTNPMTTECGIYQITKKKMSFYTGYNYEAIDNILKRLIASGKIHYDEANSEVLLVNKLKYVDRAGKPVIDCILSELKNVKNRNFIQISAKSITNEQICAVYSDYLGVDVSLTIRGQEEEEEEEEDKEEEDSAGAEWPSFNDFWNLYDKKTSRPKCEKLWKKLDHRAREQIMLHLTSYIPATPDKKFRKNPETYLRNEGWNDEVIPATNRSTTQKDIINYRKSQVDNV